MKRFVVSCFGRSLDPLNKLPLVVNMGRLAAAAAHLSILKKQPDFSTSQLRKITSFKMVMNLIFLFIHLMDKNVMWCQYISVHQYICIEGLSHFIQVEALSRQEHLTCSPIPPALKKHIL